MTHPIKLSYNPTQLRRASRDSNLWSEMYLLAAAEGQAFQNAEILTSRQHRRDQAIELAFEQGATLDTVAGIAEKIESQLPLVEFVETFNTDVRTDAISIRVVINADRIDDEVIQRAIIMLTHVHRFIPEQRIALNVLELQGLESIS